MRTMSNLRVRTSFASIAKSRAAITFLVFVVVMAPLCIGFLRVYATARNSTLRALYGLSASLPALGILLAVCCLAVVILRRRKVVLEVGPELHITRSGVRLSPQQLTCVQTWSRRTAALESSTYLALIPGHIAARMSSRLDMDTRSGAPKELEAYIADFPPGANPNVFEVVEWIQEENPNVKVEKLGHL